MKIKSRMGKCVLKLTQHQDNVPRKNLALSREKRESLGSGEVFQVKR